MGNAAKIETDSESKEDAGESTDVEGVHRWKGVVVSDGVNTRVERRREELRVNIQERKDFQLLFLGSIPIFQAKIRMMLAQKETIEKELAKLQVVVHTDYMPYHN